MRRLRVDLGLIFVVVIWGIAPILFTIALESLTALSFLFIRLISLCFISASVLAIHSFHLKRMPHFESHDILLLTVSGLSGFGMYQLCYMIGLSHTTPFASALLGTTLPIFTTLILSLTRIERINLVQGLGIGLAFVGIAAFLYLANTYSGNTLEDIKNVLNSWDLLVGNLLILAANVLLSIYGVANKSLLKRYSPPELMCYTLLIGTLPLIPFSLPSVLSQDWGHISWQVWLIIAYAVILASYLTLILYNWAIGERGVFYVVPFTYLVPVITGIVAWLVLGQELTIGQIIASGVVLSGISLVYYGMALLQKNSTDMTRNDTVECLVSSMPNEHLLQE